MIIGPNAVGRAELFQVAIAAERTGFRRRLRDARRHDNAEHGHDADYHNQRRPREAARKCLLQSFILLTEISIIQAASLRALFDRAFSLARRGGGRNDFGQAV